MTTTKTTTKTTMKTTTKTTTTNTGTTSGGGRARDGAARRLSTPNPASQMLWGSQTEGGEAKETSSQMDGCRRPTPSPQTTTAVACWNRGRKPITRYGFGKSSTPPSPSGTRYETRGTGGHHFGGWSSTSSGGNEGAASARAGVAKEVRRVRVLDGGECVDALAGGLYANVLLNNLEEQDELAHHVERDRRYAHPPRGGRSGQFCRGQGVRGPVAARGRLLARMTKCEVAVMSPTSPRWSLLVPLL